MHFCPTRWNTIFYLVKSIEENWFDIANILKENKETSRIENLNVNHLSCVAGLLEPFDYASKKLEGSKLPTIHLIIPYVNKLKKSCSAGENDIEFITQVKSVLLNEILATVFPHLTKYHKIAHFLFPPTNKLLQFSSDEKLQVIRNCKEIMTSFIGNMDGNMDGNIQSNDILEDNAFADFIEINHEGSAMAQVDQEIQTLIDSGSECSFITERLKRRINLPSKRLHAQVSGINNSISAQIKEACAIQLRSPTDPLISIDAIVLVLPKLTGDLPTCQLTAFWELEDIPKKKGLNDDDNDCEEQFKTTTERNAEGKCIVSLPSRKDYPNNISIEPSLKGACSQFYRNETRLAKNPVLKTEYNRVLREYETLGHMSKISDN
ncbi:PREDICTED: uncharacterized protein LOC108371713, partial [Rhagoletis zephyria]|uniref:uncharacterized protein LOC108371713 n=1 Tax=Rhagoletis zephyria TaxID=28612 RepID=UPI0008113A9B